MAVHSYGQLITLFDYYYYGAFGFFVKYWTVPALVLVPLMTQALDFPFLPLMPKPVLLPIDLLSEKLQHGNSVSPRDLF